MVNTSKNCKVISRSVYHIAIETLSPLSVSGGDGKITDSDVLRDYDGTPFVSGSSLAGAFRDYLKLQRDRECIMGYAGDGEGMMSKLLISDLTFISEPTVITRDGVGLDENKITIEGAKFDLEAVDSGAIGSFWIEAVFREGDDTDSFEADIRKLFTGIDNGDIRLGGKKTRGFGRMTIKEVKKKTFDASNILEYRSAYDISSYTEKDQIDLGSETSDKYVTMIVPLKIEGGISIRQYQAKKGEPDYKHITANGKAVIPGTSFAGAIRSRTYAIAEEVLTDDIGTTQDLKGAVDNLFGYVNPGKKNASRISRVAFGESIISGGSFLNITRNAVSRFDASTKNGALYSETTHIGGDLSLEIKIDKDVSDWAIPLIYPALLDIQNGYLPVGGLVSIGRGILSENGPILVDGKEVQEDYLANYRTSLKEGIRNDRT